MFNMAESVQKPEMEVSPDLGDFPIDHGIMATFPPGTEVVSANRFGLSQWTITARLHVRLPDGQKIRYFVKTAKGQEGKKLM